jgi:hypothetical protein
MVADLRHPLFNARTHTHTHTTAHTRNVDCIGKAGRGVSESVAERSRDGELLTFDVTFWNEVGLTTENSIKKTSVWG